MRSPTRHAMVRVLSWAVIPLLCLSASFAHSSAADRNRKEARKQILHLEEEWRDASLRNDVSVLERLLSEDFIGIGPSGTLQTKQQLIAARSSGAIRFTRLEYSDTKVRIYGDSAVVTTIADVDGQSTASGNISGRYRYTRVYTRHNGAGAWRIVSFESSRVTSP